MVTKKSPTKTASPKKVAAKKEEPLELYHDAREVLKVLSNLRNGQAAWDYAGAIRGPDSQNELTKNITTAVIRGACPRGNNIASARETIFPTKTRFDDLFFHMSGSSHFKSHAASGFRGLAIYYRHIGNRRAYDLFIKMADAIRCRQYEECEKCFKTIMKSWKKDGFPW